MTGSNEKRRGGKQPTSSSDTGRLIFVTGISGAGRSTALRTLEDEGFETIDPVPFSLLEPIITEWLSHIHLGRSFAIGFHARLHSTRTGELIASIERARKAKPDCVTLLYLDCRTDALRLRYQETRRRHPLTGQRIHLDKAIHRERQILAPLMDRADLVLDTTGMAVPTLAAMIRGHFASGRQAMTISVHSFAFRHGLPTGADLVFDVRFLENPFYQMQLRDRTGLDPGVQDFVRADPDFTPFYTHFRSLLDFLLPRYEAQGRPYLTIAIGCTGGQHRSVAVACLLSEALLGQGWTTDCTHRDIAS